MSDRKNGSTVADRQTAAERLAEWRTNHGYSQADVGRMIAVFLRRGKAVSQVTVWKWENAHAKPRYEHAAAIEKMTDHYVAVERWLDDVAQAAG